MSYHYGCPLCHPLPNIIIGVMGIVVFGWGWIAANPAPEVPMYLIHTAFSLMMFMSGIILWFGISQRKRRRYEEGCFQRGKRPR